MRQSEKDGGGMLAKAGSRARPRTKEGAKAPTELPGWTNGLRQLYDQVVDEDLPDSFRDLLARLDDKN